MTAPNFYAQKWDKPWLTPSIAVTLITKTPYHAKLQCPFYGPVEQTATAAMNEGSIVDGLVLGRGPDVTVFHVDAFRKKNIKEMKANAERAGKIAMKAGDYQRCGVAAYGLWEKIATQSAAAYNAIQGGAIKKRLFWDDGGVHCSTEPDIHYLSSVLDLKRTRVPPTAERWQRKAASMFYHVQAAACVEGTGAKRFGWIVVEADPPHCVVVHWASDLFLAVGGRDWNYAKAVWKNCVKTDYFPAYESGEIDPMPWVIGDDREEANYALTEEGEDL